MVEAETLGEQVRSAHIAIREQEEDRARELIKSRTATESTKLVLEYFAEARKDQERLAKTSIAELMTSDNEADIIVPAIIIRDMELATYITSTPFNPDDRSLFDNYIISAVVDELKTLGIESTEKNILGYMAYQFDLQLNRKLSISHLEPITVSGIPATMLVQATYIEHFDLEYVVEEKKEKKITKKSKKRSKIDYPDCAPEDEWVPKGQVDEVIELTLNPSCPKTGHFTVGNKRDYFLGFKRPFTVVSDNTEYIINGGIVSAANCKEPKKGLKIGQYFSKKKIWNEHPELAETLKCSLRIDEPGKKFTFVSYGR